MYRGWTHRLPKLALELELKFAKHTNSLGTNKLPIRTIQYKPNLVKTCTEDGQIQTSKQVLIYKQKCLQHVKLIDTKRVQKRTKI